MYICFNLSPTANASVRIMGVLQEPPRGPRRRMEGDALLAVITPSFDVLFIISSSIVVGGQSEITIHLQHNGILKE